MSMGGNIQMNLKKTCFEDLAFFNMAQDSDQQLAAVMWGPT